MKTTKLIILMLACIYIGVGAKAQNKNTPVLPNIITVNNGTSWTSEHNFTNAVLKIEGTLTISAVASFKNCQLLMAKGASIVMTGSASVLTITNNTHIYSTTADMWAGILKNQGTGLLTINKNSIIENAENALITQTGDKIVIEDAVFKNGKNGIVFTDFKKH
jgi:hypothetical protein